MHWIALTLGLFIGINLLLLVATLHWGPARAGQEADTHPERRAA